MTQEGISKELRALNNLICRYIEFSSQKKEIERVTGNNGRIICYLADNAQKDIYQKDVEDSFEITRSTASKVLGLMEQKGFIERQSVMRDARLKKIILTDKAWEIRKAIQEDVQRMESTLTAGFSEEETETMRALLRRMRKNIADSIVN